MMAFAAGGGVFFELIPSCYKLDTRRIYQVTDTEIYDEQGRRATPDCCRNCHWGPG